MKKILFLFFMFGALTLSAADNDDIESMVETLLNKMTLEEKIRLSYAQSKFSSPGVARLGVPVVTALMVCVWKSAGTAGSMPAGPMIRVRHFPP